MKYLPGSSVSLTFARSFGFSVREESAIGCGNLPLRARRTDVTIVRPRSAAPPRFWVLLSVVTVTCVGSGT